MRIPLAVLLCLVTACSSPLPNRDPTGTRFPSVQGTSLEGDSVRLPEDLAGDKAVLLVGYVQDAQFDCDRWILGLMQAKTPVQLREVPTIEGLVPGMMSGFIDDGMRSGIPSEDWGSVVTVYDDAEQIVDLTGEEVPRNARVFLLDEDGTILWFHDRGYSASILMQLDQLARN